MRWRPVPSYLDKEDVASRAFPKSLILCPFVWKDREVVPSLGTLCDIHSRGRYDGRWLYLLLVWMKGFGCTVFWVPRVVFPVVFWVLDCGWFTFGTWYFAQVVKYIILVCVRVNI